MKINSISKFSLILITSFALTACGGSKKTVVAGPTSDITRPPVVDKSAAPTEEAVADGETISFDEWRKRRESQKQKDQ